MRRVQLQDFKQVGTGSLFWFTAVFKKIIHPTNVFPIPQLVIPKVSIHLADLRFQNIPGNSRTF